MSVSRCFQPIPANSFVKTGAASYYGVSAHGPRFCVWPMNLALFSGPQRSSHGKACQLHGVSGPYHHSFVSFNFCEGSSGSQLWKSIQALVGDSAGKRCKVTATKFVGTMSASHAELETKQFGAAKETTGDAALTSNRRGRVVLISGPTAVGKSSLALALAKRVNGEIISADSVQVYKGLDIGSSKSTPAERQGVPHHLLDIVHPTDDYNAGDFHDHARAATDDVLRRGKVPIVVGGTGLYLRWFLYGKPATPRSTPEQAAEIEAEIQRLRDTSGEDGAWDAAIAELASLGDSETPAKLARNDWYRLRRAWEILKVSGQPRAYALPPPVASSSRPITAGQVSNGRGIAEKAPGGNLRDRQSQVSTSYDFQCYFLLRPREELYRRIDQRCEEMVASGMLREAAWMLQLGISPNSSSPSRAIGYRQAMEFLEECKRSEGPIKEEHLLRFIDTFQQASRNYAKRQTVWFRGEPEFCWVDATSAQENLVEWMAKRLETRSQSEVDSEAREIASSSPPLENAGREEEASAESPSEGSMEANDGEIPKGVLTRGGERDGVEVLAGDVVKLKSYNEGKAMKRYRPELIFFNNQSHVEETLRWIEKTCSTN